MGPIMTTVGTEGLIRVMRTAIKHSVPDRVKPSFVIFDIRAHVLSLVSDLKQ